jgi:hypothetical protein
LVFSRIEKAGARWDFTAFYVSTLYLAMPGFLSLP